MDDALEQPGNVKEKSTADDQVEDGEQASDDEDGGPDWTKLPLGSLSSIRPVIPKRGEKDFEPTRDGGSALQQHMLDRMRSAMFSALDVARVSNSKNISYGIWVPTLARAHVTVARGILWTTTGHSAIRSLSPSEDGTMKTHKRLELLPEEAIYAIERGSMLCHKENKAPLSATSNGRGDEGSPMTVQQAYAEMIGLEDLSLERYQVYAYLRRLGYIVTRAHPPNSFYPRPSPHLQSTERSTTSRVNLWTFLSRKIKQLLFAVRNWWQPLSLNQWFTSLSYPLIFTSLRFIPTGHDSWLQRQGNAQSTSPYRVFYNLYKPSTPYRKTTPPPPDFSIVVINARTTPAPSLQELSDLFEILPEMPLPPPRVRATAKKASNPTGQEKPDFPVMNAPQTPWQRFLTWLSPAREAIPIQQKPRPPNPFQALKAGKKAIIVAAVDAGTISFFRFGQGAFDEWPMA